MASSMTALGLKPYHLLMSLVFTVALGAGWTMLPGEDERVAMLERDGKSKDALTLLESSYASGNRSYRTMNHMLTLYEEQGDLVKAQAVLEDMTGRWPRDVSLKKRLAYFNRNSGKGAARLAALKSQIDLRYSDSACREYISLLRLSGRASEEAAAIRICRVRGYRRADDLSRLAALAAADGDKDLAVGLLKSIDDVQRLRDVDERYQLVALLLDQDQPKEAVRRTVRWINAGKDQVLAVGLIDLLAHSKYPDAAVDVAKDAGRAGDSISLTVAERLIEQGQSLPAALYLRGWLENARFESEDVIVRFIEAALQVRDPALAFAGGRNYGLKNLPAHGASILAEALNGAGLTRELADLKAAAPALSAAVRDEVLTVNAAARDVAGATSVKNAVRPAALITEDGLETWRRSLLSRLSDDAHRKARAQGIPMPRHSYPVGDGVREVSHTKVLRKTSKVLQRTTKLKSLKIRQRLVRDGAKARAKKP